MPSTGPSQSPADMLRRIRELQAAGPAADQSDVLGKLGASGADERHAVVIATQGQLGLHTAVDMGLTPSQPPDLSRCIDWLWVIASQNLPARGCYWTPQHGWRTAVLAD